MDNDVLEDRLRRSRGRYTLAAVAALALVLSACGGDGDDASSSNGDGPEEITVWGHQGQESEVDALQNAIDGFNSSQSEVKATLQLVPEADYTSTVTTTSPGKLPDVLEYDGPMMASLVYAGKLAPLDELVAQETLDNQTASVVAQNTYPVDGKTYGVSQFDASLGIYANTDLLDEAGVTYPTDLDDVWTADEFEEVLKTLAEQDDDGQVLDIKENYGAEWPTYGFLPVAWSAGNRIISDNLAEGNLNSPAVVEAVEQFASWRQYIDPNTDDAAFLDGRVALSWVGHWMYNPYAEKFGDKLAVLPLPDFGSGTKSGQGSWGWGINPESENPQAAGKFLDYLTSDESVAAMTEANAAPPGTTSAVAESELYGADGPLALFAEQLERTCGDGPLDSSCVAVPRPITPAYPVISQQFSEAFFEAYGGGNAQELLDQAARTIDLDFKDNDDYQVN